MEADKRNKIAAAVLLPIAIYMAYTTFFVEGAATTPPVTTTAPGNGNPKGGLRTVDLAYGSAAAVAGGGARTAPPVAVPGAGAAGSTASRNSSSTSRGRVNTAQEYVPRVGGRRPEDRADPAKTDPTLRVELLARLQELTPISSGSRSLFSFADAPPPVKTPDTKIPLDKKGGKQGGPDAAKVEPPPAPVPSGPPPEQPPPAIPLKFYGFVQGQGGKRAFFRLGEEEIFMASEGQMVQGRYKIVRIGLSSAMVEDTQHKNNQQSLRIEEIPKENL